MCWLHNAVHILCMLCCLSNFPPRSKFTTLVQVKTPRLLNTSVYDGEVWFIPCPQACNSEPPSFYIPEHAWWEGMSYIPCLLCCCSAVLLCCCVCCVYMLHRLHVLHMLHMLCVCCLCCVCCVCCISCTCCMGCIRCRCRICWLHHAVYILCVLCCLSNFPPQSKFTILMQGKTPRLLNTSVYDGEVWLIPCPQACNSEPPGFYIPEHAWWEGMSYTLPLSLIHISEPTRPY